MSLGIVGRSMEGFFPKDGREVDAVMGIVWQLDDFAVPGLCFEITGAMAARDDLIFAGNDDAAFAAEFFPILEQVQGVAHHPAGGEPREMGAGDIHDAGEGSDQHEAADPIGML